MADYTRPGINDWWNNPKPGQLEAAENLLDVLEEEGLEPVMCECRGGPHGGYTCEACT